MASSRDMRYHPIFGKLCFLVNLLLVTITALMALSDDRRLRMYLLAAIVVVQHLAFLLFMINYEALGRVQWKKKEERLKAEFLALK